MIKACKDGEFKSRLEHLIALLNLTNSQLISRKDRWVPRVLTLFLLNKAEWNFSESIVVYYLSESNMHAKNITVNCKTKQGKVIEA